MLYKHDNKKRSREIDIEQYAYLVKRIANYMVAKMPSSVQQEDLVQSGMLGLLEAARKYDDTKGASFETYASIRIRGAIVDEMRRGDWAPRSVHRNTRRVAEAIAKIEAQTGQDAKDSNIAQALDISLDEYHAMIKDSASTRLFSYEETFEADQDKFDLHDSSKTFSTPTEHTFRGELLKDLTHAIKSLPERERMILSLYYEQEMNLKEIGLVLNVSESRVSQIHSQAALRLKSKLVDWQE